MIESGTVFNHEGENWEVEIYDQYEDKYICKNLASHNFRTGKFSEVEIREDLKCKAK